MKKLFLLITVIGAMTLLNSCSSDDNSDSNPGGSPGGSISFKIDGVSKTFNNVIINKEDDIEDGVSSTYITVTGTMGNSTTEVISFSTIMGEVGSQATYSFTYTNGTMEYYDNGQLNSVVQTNSSNKLKGNFSGTLIGFDGSSTVNINLTDGSYDITH